MRTRIRPQLLLLAATLTLTAVALPVVGGRAAATDIVVVRPGQTLTEIAAAHGTSVAELVQLNGITDPDRIQAGQRIRVAAAPRTPAPAPATTYRVVYGDSLSGIAVRFGTSVKAIAQANGISNTSFIAVGQVLTIPGATAAPAAPAAKPPAAPLAGTPNERMPATMAALVAQRQGIAQLIAAEANRQGVPAAFALAVAWQESGWQPSVISSAGAIGVMQLLPASGEWVGDVMLGQTVNLWDPASNVRAGVRLLRHYLDRYGGDRGLALAAYYQGQTATDRHGIYAVSRPYIASILELERIFAP